MQDFLLSGAATRGVLCKKVFLEISQNSHCQSLLFNKIADLRPATLFKKRLRHRRFPVNFVKFLRTLFLTEHLWCFSIFEKLVLTKTNQLKYFVSILNINLFLSNKKISSSYDKNSKCHIFLFTKIA